MSPEQKHKQLKLTKNLCSILFFTDKTEANQNVFLAIKNLFENNDPVNIVTVVVKLREQGKLIESGGAIYISELTSIVVNTF